MKEEAPVARLGLPKPNQPQTIRILYRRHGKSWFNELWRQNQIMRERGQTEIRKACSEFLSTFKH